MMKPNLSQKIMIAVCLIPIIVIQLYVGITDYQLSDVGASGTVYNKSTEYTTSGNYNLVYVDWDEYEYHHPITVSTAVYNRTKIGQRVHVDFNYNVILGIVGSAYSPLPHGMFLTFIYMVVNAIICIVVLVVACSAVVYVYISLGAQNGNRKK